MPLTLSRNLITALLLVCFAKNAPAQENQQSTLQALLSEVKLLRAAIERSNQLAPRIQIGLARMQLQDERVRSATRRVEVTHDEASNTQRRRAELTDILSKLESQASQAADDNVRKAVAEQIGNIKAELESVSAKAEQLSAREGETMAVLLREQTKWNEVNDQLVSLERGLTAP